MVLIMAGISAIGPKELMYFSSENFKFLKNFLTCFNSKIIIISAKCTKATVCKQIVTLRYQVN